MWRLEYRSDAEKAIERLDKGTRLRVLSALERLARDPRAASNVKALVGSLGGRYRLRVGDYRVVYELIDGRLVVLVIDIAHRREVYRPR
jgi:mRNA interferase RelE/StbE